MTPSLRRRMACWLYEGLLLFGVVFISGYLFSTLSQTRHALDNRHGLQAFIFLVFGVYFTWFWHKGQTLAMKTWHIRIVDAQGRALTQKRDRTIARRATIGHIASLQGRRQTAATSKQIVRRSLYESQASRRLACSFRASSQQ